MFVGHYAAAFAAKTAEPRAPLWTYMLGAQLIDVAWGGLVMAGVEKIRFDPSLPGSPLVLEHMPFTHSLPAAILWAVAAALACRFALKLPWRASTFVGLVVFSHWLLDLVVHRPDLELWFGGDKVGFGLWDHPVQEQAVEIGLLGLSVAAWMWTVGRARRGAGPGLILFAALLGLQLVGMTTAPGSVMEFGGMAVGAYLAVALLAWAIERPTRA
jgi:hypothetical protein